MLTTGALLLVSAILFWFFPRVLVYPLVVLFVWNAVVLFYKAYKLYTEDNKETDFVKERVSSQESTTAASRKIKSKTD